MKILIYGSTGWMGKLFVDFLKNQKIEFIQGQARGDNYENLKNEISQSNCSNIISFIGRTHGFIGDKYYPTIDYLEQDKLHENIRDNLFAPLQLAIICRDLGLHFTYIGTGCIFEYDDIHTTENGFTEESDPNFFGSSYSIVKGFTDRIMKIFGMLNLRIRMPITGDKDPRNFITKISSYKKICSHPNSMSVLPNLFPVIIKMLDQKLTGTFNMVNPGVISHNDILELYKEIVDPSKTWENMTDEEQNGILACRRSNNYLETTKLKSLFPEVKDIKDAVIDCLKSYPK